MKRCPRCERTLPLGDFAWNRARRDGLQIYCRPCQRAYLRAHYAANIDYYVRKAKRSNPKHIARLRSLLQALKAVPCADCGQQFPPCAMDFDHVTGVKVINVGQAIAYGQRKLLAEAAKCEVVCANCHRARTLRRLLEQRDEAIATESRAPISGEDAAVTDAEAASGQLQLALSWRERGDTPGTSGRYP